MLKATNLVGFANSLSAAVPLAVTNTATTANVASTSIAINLPTGIVAGQLLLAFLYSATSGRALTVPSGWTKLVEATAGTAVTGTVAYKWTDGTEGATATFTVGSSTALSTICFLISGAQNAGPEFDFSTGTTSSPDPTIITPTWGNTKQSLIVAVCFHDLGAPTYPTGYPDTRIHVNNVQGNTPSVSTASKVATVTSDNPGAFSLSGATNWRTYTIAVRAA